MAIEREGELKTCLLVADIKVMTRCVSAIFSHMPEINIMAISGSACYACVHGSGCWSEL